MSMLRQVPGIKIGMTQVFDEARNVVPVTVVACGQWIVTQVKTVERDGYNALQVGYLKKRFASESFHQDMLKSKKRYFESVREIKVDDIAVYKVGQTIGLQDVDFDEQEIVTVTGISIGRGFQGVVKRWGFSGGPGAHGSTFHRSPGSIGNIASQGNVIKGKKLPGQTGGRQITVKGLRIVKIDKGQGIILIKGAVPGKKDAILYLRKQG